MKRFAVSALAAVLAGCSTAPVSFQGSTPTPADGAYSCVMREINRLGYTVANADRDGGFIAAEKQTSGLGTALLTGQKYASQLTVAIFDSTEQGSTTLRVTAGQSNESAMGFGAASKTGIAPSSQGKADARALLGACAAPTAEAQEQEYAFVVEGRV